VTKRGRQGTSRRVSKAVYAGKSKHHGSAPRAHFERDPEDGKMVGKCASGVSQELAQQLLEDAVPYSSPGWRKGRPQKLFNVHQGVPYRAHGAGNRYHAFPELPENIPPQVEEALRNRAEDAGDVEVFDEWMRSDHGRDEDDVGRF